VPLERLAQDAHGFPIRSASPAGTSGSPRLSEKPLVIEARVPLVMERRKPVNQP
jgi:hypothetical protein